MDLSSFDIGSLVATIGLIITVIKLYLDQLKERERRKMSERYLRALSQVVESHIKTQESQQQLETQKLQWQVLKDVGKTLWELSKSEELED